MLTTIKEHLVHKEEACNIRTHIYIYVNIYIYIYIYIYEEPASKDDKRKSKNEVCNVNASSEMIYWKRALYKYVHIYAYTHIKALFQNTTYELGIQI